MTNQPKTNLDLLLSLDGDAQIKQLAILTVEAASELAAALGYLPDFFEQVFRERTSTLAPSIDPTVLDSGISRGMQFIRAVKAISADLYGD